MQARRFFACLVRESGAGLQQHPLFLQQAAVLAGSFCEFCNPALSLHPGDSTTLLQSEDLTSKRNKASNCGHKQQWISPDKITLTACSCHIHIGQG